MAYTYITDTWSETWIDLEKRKLLDYEVIAQLWRCINRKRTTMAQTVYIPYGETLEPRSLFENFVTFPDGTDPDDLLFVRGIRAGAYNILRLLVRAKSGLINPVTISGKEYNWATGTTGSWEYIDDPDVCALALAYRVADWQTAVESLRTLFDKMNLLVADTEVVNTIERTATEYNISVPSIYQGSDSHSVIGQYKQLVRETSNITDFLFVVDINRARIFAYEKNIGLVGVIYPYKFIDLRTGFVSGSILGYGGSTQNASRYFGLANVIYPDSITEYLLEVPNYGANNGHTVLLADSYSDATAATYEFRDVDIYGLTGVWEDDGGAITQTSETTTTFQSTLLSYNVLQYSVESAVKGFSSTNWLYPFDNKKIAIGGNLVKTNFDGAIKSRNITDYVVKLNGVEVSTPDWLTVTIDAYDAVNDLTPVTITCDLPDVEDLITSDEVVRYSSVADILVDLIFCCNDAQIHTDAYIDDEGNLQDTHVFQNFTADYYVSTGVSQDEIKTAYYTTDAVNGTEYNYVVEFEE